MYRAEGGVQKLTPQYGYTWRHCRVDDACPHAPAVSGSILYVCRGGSRMAEDIEPPDVAQSGSWNCVHRTACQGHVLKPSHRSPHTRISPGDQSVEDSGKSYSQGHTRNQADIRRFVFRDEQRKLRLLVYFQAAAEGLLRTPKKKPGSLLVSLRHTPR